MLNKSGGYKLSFTVIILLVISLFVLPDNKAIAIRGAQNPIIPTDAQSTTSAEPPGGPRGAAAEAGESFTPGPLSKVIEHVPAYIWYNGCGPTSAGMILGYWNWYERQYGYNWVIPVDSEAQTQAVNDTIASPGHIADYAIPHDVFPDMRLDKSESPFGDEHVSNSIAD